MGAVKFCLLVGLLLGSLAAEDKSAYTFGTTVVDSSGLQGRVYYLKPKTQALPDFNRLKPVGSVYTSTLNIWPQHFDSGFPGISERYEWFAIEYTGKFWIEEDGSYRFSLLADDGARLYLDDKLVIDNDGVHRATAASGGGKLTRGVHEIKVQYFQGPRFTVALVLAIARADEPWRIFNMNDFKPPKDLGEWEKGQTLDVQSTTFD